MEEYQIKFKNRILKHIELVNKYAKIIGHTYPYHDADKLGPLFQAYSLSKKYDQGYETYEGLPEDEAKIYNDATIKHILNNPHHPEFFANRRDRKRIEDEFTRENPPMMIDSTKMTDEAILEMCCDWCAMSEEFGNTPWEWFDQTCGYIKYDDYDPPMRWLFTNHQYDLIVNTLEKLWGDNEDD